MTQKFAEDGSVIPVTRVVAGPCVVTQVKTDKTDGYTSVQLGFGSKKNLSKPVKKHLKDLGNFAYLKEFRITEAEANKLPVGTKITAKVFSIGDVIKATGVSKGKGFQGVVKRHGFHGSPATHGHKDQLRMPGSIGAGGPQHVFKGTRMGGRMGGEIVTVTNLKIVEVNPQNNEIFIKGALPGAKSNLLLLAGVGDLIIEVEEIKEQKSAETAETVEAATAKTEVAAEIPAPEKETVKP